MEIENGFTKVTNLFKNCKVSLTVLSGIALVFGLFLSWFKIAPQLSPFLYLLSLASGGFYVYREAFEGFKNKAFFNINLLVTIASIGAVFINQWAEAASVVFFFSLAEMFEEFGIKRSQQAITNLIKESPQKANKKEVNNIVSISIEEVNIGDIVVVKPGDKIPLDGKVVKGNSAVDEAAITGESLPKEKLVGDLVFAGTMNMSGYLEIKITKRSKDSVLSKVIATIEEAQEKKAPSQEFIDKFAAYYTPTVVIGAVLLTIVPVLLGGTFTQWLYRSLTLLVIACPCALVISTPVSVASAIGRASQKGSLIKGGKFLEAIGKVKAIAFDKTRTLTEGKPIVSDILTFNGFSKEEVLADACGISKFDTHPLSFAIKVKAEEESINPHIMEKFKNTPGKGSKANCTVCDDLTHCVGNLKLLNSEEVNTKEVEHVVENLAKEGKTTILVSEGKVMMGVLGITDSIRPEAIETIGQLKRLGISNFSIISGDNAYAVDYVAQKLGVNNTFAQLLPGQKLETIEKLKQEYGTVSMVGDGINDSPSLAASDVGIALGSAGSDVAIETADIALMGDDLRRIPYLIKLGRQTTQVIKQNIYASLGIKAIFLTLGVFGLTHLGWAIAADSGVALLVTLNGLRLFRA